MRIHFTPALHDDLDRSLDDAIVGRGIVNIPRLSEQIRQRNEEQNVALEDIAAELMRRALARNALMEFDPLEA
jgi:hypothetical protein